MIRKKILKDLGSEKESDKKGIEFSKEKNFSEWYTQVVQKAEMADYAPVKGFMVIRPNAYRIWEKIQEYFNEVIRKKGVKNAYFPLLIPDEFFKKEAKHAEGFAPELAYIKNTEEGELLAIRPTSETIMYDSYSKWVRSWRDLPLKINQWCNVVRWEVKQTKPFIRTREFLWQEGHCVFSSKKEADENMNEMILEYQKLLKDLLAIPAFVGRKSQKERFPGADTTMTLEALMPDGRALQCGTSHNLGQNFAKTFDVKYLGKDGKSSYAWQTSWGFSTRLIGALIMIHGDNHGLVLPPRVAENKIVIVPIMFDDSKKDVLKKAREIEERLERFGCILDEREEYKPGFKYNEWEMKGIPIRIEIGPLDIKKGTVVLVRRDTSEKSVVEIDNLEEIVKKTLEDIQKNLYDKAKKFIDNNVVEVDSLREMKEQIAKGKIVRAYFTDSPEIEDEIKFESDGATSRIVEDVKKSGVCIKTGKKTNTIGYFAKSY